LEDLFEPFVPIAEGRDEDHVGEVIGDGSFRQFVGPFERDVVRIRAARMKRPVVAFPGVLNRGRSGNDRGRWRTLTRFGVFLEGFLHGRDLLQEKLLNFRREVFETRNGTGRKLDGNAVGQASPISASAVS
jgi:hypothetical protein